MAGLVLGNPGARFFNNLREHAYATVGIPNTLTYTTYAGLQIAIRQHIIPELRSMGFGGQRYYDFILIAGHGSMIEETGAPSMFADLTADQWTSIVAQMVQKSMVAPVIILDGCKTGSFVPIFEPLARPYNHAGRHFSVIMCNLADSSTTVFGSLIVGDTLAAAIQGKMNLEVIPARPPRPIIIQVPGHHANEGIRGMTLMWDGAAWRENTSKFRMQDVDDTFDAWAAAPSGPALGAPTNHQLLMQLAPALAPVWSAQLFRPTAVIECTQPGRGRTWMPGPFLLANWEEDMKAAYGHWQRYGPGGVALLVFEDEIMRMLDRLDVNFTVFDDSAHIAATVALLTDRIMPAFNRPRPTRRHRPTRFRAH